MGKLKAALKKAGSKVKGKVKETGSKVKAGVKKANAKSKERGAKVASKAKEIGGKIKEEVAKGGVVGTVQKAAEGGPSMKSKVYMSGTSMGSGVNMKSGCTISKHMKGSGMNMSSSSRHDSGGPKMAPLVGMAVKALAPMVMGKITDELGKKSDK